MRWTRRPPMRRARSAWRRGAPGPRRPTTTAAASAPRTHGRSPTPTCIACEGGPMTTATATRLQTSTLDPRHAVHDHTVPAGEPYFVAIGKGQTLRLVDLEGNQAIDALFYGRDESGERYSA